MLSPGSRKIGKVVSSTRRVFPPIRHPDNDSVLLCLENMKSAFLCVAIAAVTFIVSRSFASADTPEHHVKDGTYRGLQPETYVDPEDREARWFHENRLLVRNDEAILDKVTVVFSHGKMGYSASDGGFFTYRARFSRRDGQVLVALRLCQSDYVLFPADKHDQYTEVKTYPVKIVSGRLEFNGVMYKPAALKKIELSRLEQLLSTGPLEKTDAKR